MLTEEDRSVYELTLSAHGHGALTTALPAIPAPAPKKEKVGKAQLKTQADARSAGGVMTETKIHRFSIPPAMPWAMILRSGTGRHCGRESIWSTACCSPWAASPSRFQRTKCSRPCTSMVHAPRSAQSSSAVQPRRRRKKISKASRSPRSVPPVLDLQGTSQTATSGETDRQV